MKKLISSCGFQRQLFILSAVLVCAALWMAQQTFADSGASIPPVAVPAQTGRGAIKGERCNVRSRANLNSEVITQLHKGDVVDVLERKFVTEGEQALEWLRISLPATAKCYVNAKHLTNGTTNVENLNVRCGPGSNYRDIGKLSKGTKIEVVETKGEWTEIKPTSQCSGWIVAELVEMEAVVAPAPSASATAVVTPPVAASATELPPVSIVNIDPDVEVRSVVKDGYWHAVMEPGAPASYELRTMEVQQRSYRIAYLETTETNLKKFEGKHVRVVGNQHWRRGDRYPVISVERLDLVW
jgi:uncharacterized protein YgiM (DUF1202 family)